MAVFQCAELFRSCIGTFSSAQCYPALRAEDLANAWAYYRAHRDEIEQQILENEGTQNYGIYEEEKPANEDS